MELQEELKALQSFNEVAFEDLVQLSKDNSEVFEELYYNRVDECQEFLSVLKDGKKTGRNILITGEAGIGKSNFVYKLLSNSKKQEELSIHSIILDYRNVVPQKIEGLLKQFVSKMQHYFDNIIDRPLFFENEIVDDRIGAIYEHLDKIPRESFTKTLVLFVDDLDYADDVWYELLNYILPFAISRRASLVLSVRPPLLNSIEMYDDRFRQHYIRRGHTINLGSLQVENILSTRIAPILEEEQAKSIWSRITKLFRRNSTLCKIVKDLGCDDLESLPRIHYPFTAEYNTLLRRITNGNLREIFLMAASSLLYIWKNRDNLEKVVEFDNDRFVLTKKQFLDLFVQTDTFKPIYKIIDIVNEKSKSGNSLLFNALLGIKLYKTVDKYFYDRMQLLGLPKMKVKNAIEYLSNKNNRHIYPKFSLHPKEPQRIDVDMEYVITEKGEIYLQMATDWDYYKDIFGNVGRTLDDY